MYRGRSQLSMNKPLADAGSNHRGSSHIKTAMQPCSCNGSGYSGSGAIDDCVWTMSSGLVI